jgi:preprotein translocase subunit YajC
VDPTIVLLLGLLVLVYLNFAGRRRAQRRRAEMDQRLVPGAEIVTTSGLHGSVDEVDDDGTVLLEIAPGWVTRWEKAAVARVIALPTDEVAEEDEAAAGATETAETPDPAEPYGTAQPAEPYGTAQPEPYGTAEPTVPAEPTAGPGTDPTPEPGARPLPDTAPPDRA